AIVDSARRLGIAAKAGLHTGECEIRPDGLTGAALEVARRVAAVAKDGEVVVSTTVKDLVAGSGLEFLARGEKADGDGTRGQSLVRAQPGEPINPAAYKMSAATAKSMLTFC